MIQRIEEKLMDLVSRFIYDPLGFVRNLFAWGKGILKGEEGPEEWQTKVLRDIGEHFRSNPYEPLYYAIASGHGVGKTALVSWLVLWFISTRPNPQIVVTANTKKQLDTKTWRELAKWHKLLLNSHWFEWTASKFYYKRSPETWFASAIPWSKEKSEAFAGTHEKYTLMIFDEASAIDDEIWEVASGSMLDPNAIWFVCGNPTRSQGRFRECFPGGRFAHRWKTMRVDSRSVSRSNKKQIEEWINDYGEDSDFVRVRVKGMFPRASISQFISEDIVDQAMNSLVYPGDREAPIVIGVDVARFGDDESVIVVRRGRILEEIKRFSGIDTMKFTGHITEVIREVSPSAVFVDSVGIGAGVCDRLRQLGYSIIDVNGAEKPINENLYKNLRAEMWDKMRTWLKSAVLPRDDELKTQLCGVEYGFDERNRIQIEKKESMKSRGLRSPDIADALALTFAYPINEVHRQKVEEFRRMYEIYGPPSAMAV